MDTQISGFTFMKLLHSNYNYCFEEKSKSYVLAKKLNILYTR